MKVTHLPCIPPLKADHRILDRGIKDAMAAIERMSHRLCQKRLPDKRHKTGWRCCGKTALLEGLCRTHLQELLDAMRPTPSQMIAAASRRRREMGTKQGNGWGTLPDAPLERWLKMAEGGQPSLRGKSESS